MIWEKYDNFGIMDAYINDNLRKYDNFAIMDGLHNW